MYGRQVSFWSDLYIVCMLEFYYSHLMIKFSYKTTSTEQWFYFLPENFFISHKIFYIVYLVRLKAHYHLKWMAHTLDNYA